MPRPGGESRRRYENPLSLIAREGSSPSARTTPSPCSLRRETAGHHAPAPAPRDGTIPHLMQSTGGTCPPTRTSFQRRRARPHQFFARLSYAVPGGDQAKQRKTPPRVICKPLCRLLLRSLATPSLPEPNSCSDRVEQVPRKRETRDSDLCKFCDPGGRNIKTGHSEPKARGLNLKRLDVQSRMPPQLPHRLVQLFRLYLHLDDEEPARPVQKQKVDRAPLTRCGRHRNFLAAKRQPWLQQIRICRHMIGEPVVPLHALASLDAAHRPRLALEQRLEEVLGFHVPVLWQSPDDPRMGAFPAVVAQTFLPKVVIDVGLL